MERSSFPPPTDSLPPLTSCFPPPTVVDCGSILSQIVNYGLVFKIENFRYIIKVSTIDRTQVDKTSPLLNLYEINGSEDGIFTWLLCDFGDGTSKQIFVKKMINISEIYTKHTDILKDLCLGKDTVEHQESIRVYFGGELLKKTVFEGEREYVKYNINLLSGTYSDGRIDSIAFSPEFETDLKSLFVSGINDDGIPYVVNILHTDKTMINMDEPEKFESSLIDYIHTGAKVYKFDITDETQLKISNRAFPDAEMTYNARCNQLKNAMDRLIVYQEYELGQIVNDPTKANEINVIIENIENIKLDCQRKIKNLEKPASLEELEPYLFTPPLLEVLHNYGGKSRRSRRSRKSRKYNKSKTYKK